MFKVMIVDDEILVRVGLKSTINWEAINFTIIAEASNGEQAYELFLKYEPDVILTDIRMPKMDGLKLTELVKAKRPHTKIVILTCYDTFSYAREALKLGASNYLLKSEIEDEELLTIMKNIHNELNSEMGRIERYSILQWQINSNINVLKEKLLSDLIDSKMSNEQDFYSKCESLHVNLNGGRYALAVLYKDNLENFTGYTDADWQIMNSGIINITSELLGEKGMSFLMSSSGNALILLINMEGFLESEMENVITRVKDSILKYLNISLTIIISRVFDNLFLAGTMYKELNGKSGIMFYNDRGSIAASADIRFNDLKPNEFKERYTKALIASLDEDDLDCANEIIDTIEKDAVNKYIDPMQVKLYVIGLINDLMERFTGCISNENRSEHYSGFSNQIFNSSRIQVVTNLIKLFISDIVNDVRDNRVVNSRKIIHKAMSFIHCNFDKKITLEALASHVSLSKQYLCYFFKRETGENISVYINKVRIDKAKEMIKKYDYKVKELFDKVGFSDQQYFCKSFKKMTGITVAEYKAEILKKAIN